MVRPQVPMFFLALFRMLMSRSSLHSVILLTVKQHNRWAAWWNPQLFNMLFLVFLMRIFPSKAWWSSTVTQLSNKIFLVILSRTSPWKAWWNITLIQSFNKIWIFGIEFGSMINGRPRNHSLGFNQRNIISN